MQNPPAAFLFKAAGGFLLFVQSVHAFKRTYHVEFFDFS